MPFKPWEVRHVANRRPHGGKEALKKGKVSKESINLTSSRDRKKKEYPDLRKIGRFSKIPWWLVGIASIIVL